MSDFWNIDLGTIISSVLNVVMIGVSIWIARISMRALATQTDPCVIVYIASDTDAPSKIYLICKNIGSSMAHDVSFGDTKKLSDLDLPFHRDGRSFLEIGIKALAPGEHRKTLLGLVRDSEDSLRHKMKDQIVGLKITFYSDNRKKFTRIDNIEFDSFGLDDAAESKLAKIEKHLAKTSKAISQIEGKIKKG